MAASSATWPLLVCRAKACRPAGRLLLRQRGIALVRECEYNQPAPSSHTRLRTVRFSHTLERQREGLAGNEIDQHASHTGAAPEELGHVLDYLESRNMIHQLTAPTSMREHLAPGTSRLVYLGIDPSASSLHIGNLLPLMTVLHLVRHGHRAVLVLGSATATIGDPSGRDTERPVMDSGEINENNQKIATQLRSILDRAVNVLRNQSEDVNLRAKVKIMHNGRWWDRFPVTSFLRDVGKYARISTMLARDSVKSRMEPQPHPSGQGTLTPKGLSFTEFSYQLLQAGDFSVLHGGPYKCTVQIGGSDQMGNIAAGIDLIRKRPSLLPLHMLAYGSKKLSEEVRREESGEEKERGMETRTIEERDETGSSNVPQQAVLQETADLEAEQAFKDGSETSKESRSADEGMSAMPAYGLTVPLLTTASGAKFGKSAGNAIWLSPRLTSQFDFYQYFLRTGDEEVKTYLEALTFLSTPQIEEIMQKHDTERSARHAQTALADAVTELVRGPKALLTARAITNYLYKNDVSELTINGLIGLMQESEPNGIFTHLSPHRVLDKKVIDVLCDIQLFESRSAARRAVESGGVYMNSKRIPSAGHIITKEDYIESPPHALVFKHGHKVLFVITTKDEMSLKNGEVNDVDSRRHPVIQEGS